MGGVGRSVVGVCAGAAFAQPNGGGDAMCTGAPLMNIAVFERTALPQY